MFNRNNEYSDFLRSRAPDVRHAFQKVQVLFSRALTYIGPLSFIAKGCLAYLKGDLDHVINGTAFIQLHKDAKTNAKGVAKLRIGTPFLGRNIYYIGTQLTDSQSESMLKTIMDLPEEEARNPYRVFKEIFGDSFFLSETSKNGVHQRAKFKQYLNVELFEQEAERNVFDLFEKIKHRQLLDQGSVIRQHIQSFYAKIFFGFDFCEALSQFFMKIEKVAEKYFFHPRFMLLMSEEVQLLRAEFRELTQKFLQDNLSAIQDQISKKSPDKKINFLIDTILEKFPDAKKGKLSQKDVKKLASDPDILLCVSVLFAVSNLTFILNKGLAVLFDRSNFRSRSYRNTIRGEIRMSEHSSPDRKILFDRDKMPTLHAFYVETLKRATPLAFISRYTKKGFQVEGYDFSPNSIILFDMTGSRKLLGDHSAPLHKGSLTPFGLGRRMCPAMKLTEVIFKHYVVSFAKYVKRLDSEIEFFPVLNPDSQMIATNGRDKEEEDSKESANVDIPIVHAPQKFFEIRAVIPIRVKNRKIKIALLDEAQLNMMRF
ncbi:MAG: hypothetical protein P4M14_00345 [Gammaproteobacteria bacterium]|nr:hypothetical protein [Gammaproteobacteria bacterium]